MTEHPVGRDETYFSTAEAARFFGRSAGWLSRAVRDEVLTYPDGSPIEVLRVGRSGRLRFTPSVLSDIAHACHRRGVLNRRQVDAVLDRLSHAALTTERRGAPSPRSPRGA